MTYHALIDMRVDGPSHRPGQARDTVELKQSQY